MVTYAAYIDELRRRIVLITKIFVGFFVLGFFSTTPIIRFMMEHMDFSGVTIVTTSPFQLMDLAMSIGFFIACTLTVPVFIYHLYSFLKPGLLAKERTYFLLALPVGIGLFFFGFLYGVGIMYYGIELIADVNINLGVANYWDIGTFISQIVLTSSLLGLLFIFPIIVTFLIRLGIFSVDMLRLKRRHAIVIIFIFVSLLPPTDGVSLILMSVPLALIFELTIFFNRKKKTHHRLPANAS
ncbi:MAG: preprotein translocase subunit TatC [Candidatus Yonathbacteria bacterium]|nr:preprotein translocase subunit TatC [Candidatus Yonathbacteria bacterium]